MKPCKYACVCASRCLPEQRRHILTNMPALTRMRLHARWADDAELALWVNLSGCVAAGVGNGVGTFLAGSSTANGRPYAFSFQLEDRGG